MVGSGYCPVRGAWPEEPDEAGTGNIALRRSAGLEVHSSTYKH
jgi:hypothetical protein